MQGCFIAREQRVKAESLSTSIHIFDTFDELLRPARAAETAAEPASGPDDAFALDEAIWRGCGCGDCVHGDRHRPVLCRVLGRAALAARPRRSAASGFARSTGPEPDLPAPGSPARRD